MLMTHSEATSLAAFISQAGQGSSREAVSLQRTSALEMSSNITALKMLQGFPQDQPGWLLGQDPVELH